jgi:hypothetical protein
MIELPSEVDSWMIYHIQNLWAGAFCVTIWGL